MTILRATGQMTAADARHTTDQIKGALIVAYDLMIECHNGRADLALGYESWDAYCATEFGGARMVRLQREQRQEIVSTMRVAGMSTRAIGSALGVDHKTAVNDLRATGETSPDDRPATVTSLDGRERPASRPMTMAEINAITPAWMVAEQKAEAERALPAYSIAMALDDLLSEGVDPEVLVRDCPAHDRDQLIRVPEALTFLSALNNALEATR